MLVQHDTIIYIDTIKTFDGSIESWFRKSRLNKSKGMLTYIVNHLTELDDDLILQKLNKLKTSSEEIASIIYSKKNDLEKKTMIIELMNGELDGLDQPTCYICKMETCRSIEFCETKMNNWLGI